MAVRKKLNIPKSKKAAARKAVPAGIRANSAKRAARPKPKRAPAPKVAAKQAKRAIKAALPAPPAPKKPSEGEQLLLRRVGKILSDSHVRQNLIDIGGENALAIVRNFFGNHSDEELAKRLKIKISDVRATLNKLHNEGLVNYIREKDSETGWYSYSWSLNHQRMERWASTQVGRPGAVGTDAGEEYYFCPACGASSIINFESAATLEFRCERCSKMLEFIDEKRIAELYSKDR